MPDRRRYKGRIATSRNAGKPHVCTRAQQQGCTLANVRDGADPGDSHCRGSGSNGAENAFQLSPTAASDTNRIYNRTRAGVVY